MSMRSILFVDDEPMVLRGLENALRRLRREYDMVFACGGEAAMRALALAPFDLVVSDMRMPGIDGAALLGHVQATHPATARIVLSGQTEPAVARRLVDVAHQFLSKPCDARELRDVVERTSCLRALVADPEVRTVVGQIAQLPVAPGAIAALRAALAEPDVTLDTVEEIVVHDVALSAKVLQLVSSAFFGSPHAEVDPARAVRCLGLESVRGLAQSIDSFATPIDGVDETAALEEVRRDALLVARLAERIAGAAGSPVARTAFSGGLLHDTGALILAAHFPTRYAALRDGLAASGQPLHEVDLEGAGVTHAELGAYLLGLWGLTARIVEAVACHHAPERIQVGAVGEPPSAAFAVHIAVALAGELDGSSMGEATMALLERAGASARVPAWRLACHELACEGLAAPKAV